MALGDNLDFIKQMKEGLLATSRGVQQGRDAYDELTEQIRLAKNQLKYKKSTRHADVHARNVVKALKAENELRNILIAEIDDAVNRASKEFSDYSELYKSHLYEVAQNEDIFLIVPTGDGWATSVSPQIIFEHAGTLHDYARGIKLYRQTLKTKIGQPGSGRGAKATSWWYSNVYANNSLYERTVNERIELSGRPAPFWSLLAHGSVSLSSDRPDGSFNPLNAKGVDFISHTEDAIRNRFNSLMTAERIQWEEETKQFEDEIRRAEKVLRSFEKFLEELTTEYEKNQATLRRFGENAQYVDEDRLAIAARRLRADEKLETKYITLSYRGSPKTVRPLVRTLEGRLEY